MQGDVASHCMAMASTSLLLVAGRRIAGRVTMWRSLTFTVTVALTVSWCIVCISGFVLHLLGCFCAPALHALAASLASLCLLVDRYGAFDRAVGDEPQFRRRGNAGRSLPSLTLAGGLLFLGLCRVYSAASGTFPLDWDTLAYHLPLVDQWIIDRTLYVPGCAYWYVPGNNELWTMWFTGALSGDALHWATSIPGHVLFACGLYELLMALDVDHNYAALMTACSFATPVVVRQLGTCENDVAAAATYVAAMCYAVHYIRTLRTRYLLLCASALGLCAGTKYLCCLYVAGTLCALVVATYMPLERRRGVAHGLVALAGILLFGGFWYFRNASATGEPWYPKAVSAGEDVWSYTRPGSVFSILAFSRRPAVWGLMLTAACDQCGPHYALMLTFIPGALVLVPLAMWRSERREYLPRHHMWALLNGLFALDSALVTPNVVETTPWTCNSLLGGYHSVRLTLLAQCAVVCAAPCIVRLLCRPHVCARVSGGVPPHSARSALGAIGLGGLGVVALGGYARQMTALAPEVGVGGLISSAGVALLLMWFVNGVRTRRVAATVMYVLISFSAWLLAWRVGIWHEQFDAFYKARGFGVVRGVDGLDYSRSRVCVCDYTYYPYFGSYRQCRPCRPLFVGTSHELQGFITLFACEWVIVPVKDIGSQQRYAAALRCVEELPGRFAFRKRVGNAMLYEVLYKP